MSNYLTIPYGAGYLYGSNGGADAPIDLRFYRTNIDNVYVFHWGFDPSFISPTLTSLDFELQLASEPSFTLDLTSFLSTDALTYQNGDVRKGYAVPVPVRVDKQTQTWYARVRTKVGVSFSDWSNMLQFTIIEKFELEETENLMLNLPDEHVYGKEDLKKAIADRNTNLYIVMTMYGRELDLTKLEDVLTATNIQIDLCRDENLYDNFGIFFGYIKPPTQEFVEYREALRALILASLEGSTVDAILKVVKSFTGVNPSLNLIRDRRDLFLSTISEVPTQISTTHFATSSDYIPKTLTIYRNGTLQHLNQDYTENHSSYGFDLIVPSFGDAFNVFFDIGQINDPIPVVLDQASITALTGTLDVITGSTAVVGHSTSFLSELAPRMLLTMGDPSAVAEIDTITSNTSLTLKYAWTGENFLSSLGYRVDFNSALPLAGNAVLTNGSTSLTGISTQFSTELHIGDIITDELGSNFGTIASVTNSVTATLQAPWTGSTSIPTTQIRRLTYADMTLWSTGTLAHGLIILVHNPGHISPLETSLLELLVKEILPAHILVYFEYE